MKDDMAKNNGKSVILFIEPDFLSHPLILRAKEKGYFTLAISSKANLHSLPEDLLNIISSHYLLDIHDEEGVLDLVRKLNQKFYIAGVIPSYGGCLLSSKIALYLNRLGINPDTLLGIQNQYTLHNSLKLQGISLPEYEKVETYEDLELTLKKIKFPCLIKPIEFASIGKAKKAQNFKEALETFHATITPKGGEAASQTGAIVEEYIPGEEFIIDGFVKHNHLYLFSLAERLFHPHTCFEKIGYLARSEASYRFEIEFYLKSILSALKIDFGPFHAKIKLTSKGPILIGLTLSFAKTYVTDLLKYASGVNYIENTLRLFLGAPLALHKSLNLHAGIIFFNDLGRKKARSTKFFEMLVKNPCIKEVKSSLQEDIKLSKPSCKGKTQGHIIFAHQDYDTLMQNIKKIKESLFSS